jgi:hypothetical protein
MRIPTSPFVAAPCRVRLSRRSGLRLFPWLGLLPAFCLLLNCASAQNEKAPPAKDEFLPLVKLAPFVVNGQSLAISIYARTNSDRHYGEQFAEGVAKVVYEAVTESTGKGLVIIGTKGEPHPIFVFRKFLALAKDGKLDPTVAARGPELSEMMDRWNGKSDDDDKEGGMDLDYEQVVTALPLPLEGVGAKLYQLAWEEKFDDAKVTAKLRALRPGDLERRDLFKSFNWVLYLPSKGAFDKVIDDLIAQALKEEKAGFFFGLAVKGVMLVEKPKIRRMIEGMRQGMMFKTIVQARTHYSEDDASALADAYSKVFEFSFDKKPTEGTDHERAVKAVRDQLRRIDEKAKKPATPPAESAKSG